MDPILSEKYYKLKEVNPNLSFDMFANFEPTLKLISSAIISSKDEMKRPLTLEYEQLKRKDSKLTFDKFLMLHNLMTTKKKLNIRDGKK